MNFLVFDTEQEATTRSEQAATEKGNPDYLSIWSATVEHWNKIVCNAITVLVASVFVGATAQLWSGVQSIDSRIESNLTEIKVTQEVLTGQVDKLTGKLAEILPLIIPDDTFDNPTKGTKELIDERRIHNQIQQQGFRP